MVISPTIKTTVKMSWREQNKIA
uniref:Uncharacterized protein n=1 Tax=Rhizophora mucronata TaxID=61149 RepID=A0A2P2KYR9_RHIMU